MSWNLPESIIHSSSLVLALVLVLVPVLNYRVTAPNKFKI